MKGPDLTRRAFGAGLAAAGIGALGPRARALGEARVVVIGGGPGGATVAGQLKRLAPNVSVTLVEESTKYTSCFFSNTFIGGFIPLGDLTHDYKGLSGLGISVIHDRAAAVDPGKRRVTLKTGKALEYDRLVVAPGIDFKWQAIEGYSEDASETMPHAWRGGSQTSLLRHRLERMEDGGTIVMAVPAMPYRCPPGPYERACVIANYLARHKPRSKLVILDAKLTFSKQAAFREAFDRYYKDRIELYLTNDIDDYALERVDPSSGEVRTRSGFTVKAALANIIPPQMAGAIAREAGLASGDWCPVAPETFRSVLAEGIYVLGDASVANEMPKSAFSAHSQALVVAKSVLADLEVRQLESVSYKNTCWSIVAPGDAIKIGADYAPGTIGGGKPGLVPSNSFVSKPGESAEERKQVFQEAFNWYPTLVSQIFNKPVRELHRLETAEHSRD